MTGLTGLLTPGQAVSTTHADSAGTLPPVGLEFSVFVCEWVCMCTRVHACECVYKCMCI